MALKVGDRVELVGNEYTPSMSNPYTNTEFSCVGTIIAGPTEYGSLSVEWDNNRTNGGYKEGRDLIKYINKRELECTGL